VGPRVGSFIPRKYKPETLQEESVAMNGARDSLDATSEPQLYDRFRCQMGADRSAGTAVSQALTAFF
jgi:hypothetical protein